MVKTDHQALLSILKEHRFNDYYNSCLSRWVDRRYRFNFKIEHLQGAKTVLLDYVYENPHQPATNRSALVCARPTRYQRLPSYNRENSSSPRTQGRPNRAPSRE